jgi:hypothetical protein
MYRLSIDSYVGSINVQSTEFEFLLDVQNAVKAVVEKHKHLMEQTKNIPLTSSSVVAMADTLFDQELAKMKPKPIKRGRGRPAGSRNKK